MWRAIQKQERALDDGNEDEGRDERYVGDGADVPSTRRAIMMIAERVVVLVMVNNAKDKHHAQIQQAHHRSRYAGFRHTVAKSGLSRYESQA